MYAILHIPTGKFLIHPKGYTDAEMLLLAYEGTHLFYSKKDAEKYKRKFLILLYLIYHYLNKNKLNIVKFPRKPSFIKGDSFRKACSLSYGALDLGLRGFDFALLNTAETNLTAVSTNEFIVIKV